MSCCHKLNTHEYIWLGVFIHIQYSHKNRSIHSFINTALSIQALHLYQDDSHFLPVGQIQNIRYKVRLIMMGNVFVG